MEKQRNIKVLAIIALLIAIIGVTIAFAAVSKTLTINGTASMDTAKWDIHLENLSAPITKGSAKVVTEPILTGTNIKGYSVELLQYGDSITYTFDIVNSGSINAVLSSFNKKTPTFVGLGDYATKDANIVKSNLTYELTYLDETEIIEGDVINSGETKTLKLVVAYTDASVSPDNDVKITGMDINMLYSQIN